MNSKLILAIAAIIVIGGGIFAVRSLTNTATVIETTDSRTEEDVDVSSADTTKDEVATRISAAQRGEPTPRSGSGRTFSRGEGAAAIDVTPATTTSEQMAAMAAAPESTGTTNLEESRQIADLANLFRNQTDPDERIDIADELGMIDNPEGIKTVLGLLKEEKDPLVQAALLEAMQALEALEQTAPEVLQATKEIYANTQDPDVQIAAQDLLADIANQDAATTLKGWREATDDPILRLNATESIMRVWATDSDLVTAEEVEMYNGQLQQEYEAGPDAAYRSQAIMGLAINGSENVEFFQQALQMEQDQQLRQLLERLVNMYTTPPPTAPPAGTVITPAPTPLIVE